MIWKDDRVAQTKTNSFGYDNLGRLTLVTFSDAAGRMTADASKGISSITWNVLGSVRVVAGTGGTAEQYNHYYPLGGPITQHSTSASLQPLKFQGKEWDDAKGFNVYDFGARLYDPALGR